MLKYEYLYFPDIVDGPDCTGLHGDRLENLFQKHHRVLKDLLRHDPYAVERIASHVAERGMDAVKIRVEVEAPEEVGVEPPRLTGDFEKLLHGALLNLIDDRRPPARAVEGNGVVSVEPVRIVGSQRPAPGRTLDEPKARRRRAKKAARLTRDADRCDPLFTMARTTRQSGLNREAAGAPGDALNVEMRIPEDVKRETERLRHRLKIISTHLARLDPQQDAHLELLEATVELNMVFGDFVDHWLRARIEPIERSFNEQFKNRESATIADKQATSKWANAELRTHGLAIRCPKTRRASILLADPGNHPAIGRFQLQHKAMDGRWKRSLSTPNLPYLKLMPDLPSLDVNLAHVLGRIDGAETVASATA